MPSPAITREQIMVALFNLAQNSSKFATAERKLRLWANVQQQERPYLGMAEREEDHTGAVRGVPPVRTYNVNFFMYTWAKGIKVPASLLNPLIDNLEAALRPPAGSITGRQTLGGLVTHVYIDGKVFKDPGDIDGDGLAIVPVKILVP